MLWHLSKTDIRWEDHLAMIGWCSIGVLVFFASAKRHCAVCSALTSPFCTLNATMFLRDEAPEVCVLIEPEGLSDSNLTLRSAPAVP